MNRLSKNTVFQLLTRGIEFSSGILVNAWLARQWGSGAFGEIGFFSGLAGMCTFLFDCGIGALLMRSISRERLLARNYIANGLVAMLPLSLLASLVLIVLGGTLSSWSALGVLLLVSLQMALFTAASILKAAFYAYERMEQESLTIFYERLLWILIGLWLSTQKPSLMLMFGGLCVCKALNLVVSALLLRGTLGENLPVRLSFKTQVDLLKRALPFGLNLCFSTVYVSIDILLLSHWAGNDVTGYYRAASMLIIPLVIVSVAFSNALFPQLTTLAREHIGGTLETSTRLLLMAAMPVSIFVVLYAEPIIRLFYGEHFQPAVWLLQLLALVIPLRFINHALGTFLTACDLQGYRTKVSASAAVFNLISNLLAIGTLLAVGACLTTILTDLLIFALYTWRLWRYSGWNGIEYSVMARSLLLSVGIVLPLAHWHLPLFAAASLFAVLYPSLLLKVGLLSSSELQLLRRQNPV